MELSSHHSTLQPPLKPLQPKARNHSSSPSAIPPPPTKSTTSLLHTPAHPQLPPNVSITPPTAATLPSYRRLITLLLPIAYPASFYAASISPPSDTFALLALWHDSPTSTPIVVAGIQARVEPAALSLPLAASTPASSSSSSPAQKGKQKPPGEVQNLYILTLALLAPYRRLGIATTLLSVLLALALSHHPSVQSVYAHVWEANTDALEWYVRRGFAVESLVAAYYRRLKPGGARVVRRAVRIEDWLLAGAETTRNAGMADNGLGVATIEKEERGKERDDGQGEVEDGHAEPMSGNNDMNENKKRRYNDGEDVNGEQRRESRRIG